MKRLVTFIFAFIYILNAWAAKSAGTPMLVFQPDGMTVTIQLLGDENFSWYQTTDGVLLVRNESEYYIAKVVKGDLVSTGILAHDECDRTKAEKAAIAAQDKAAFQAQADNSVRTRRNAVALLDKKNFSPHMGEIHIPIILMNYTDKQFVLGNGDKEKLYEIFEEYFNGTTKTPYTSETRFKGYSSVRQYFVDASYGKFTPVFDLYGPYTTSREHDYYGKASGRTSYLLKEAIQLADPDIDFSKYDSNNDGNADLVYVLYAGTGANLSGNRNDVWPACWCNRTFSTQEGKTVNIIGVSNELATNSFQGEPIRAGIGVFCHEMSHGLGLPDLYWTLGYTPTDVNGEADFDNCGPEDWDIMDGGENLYAYVYNDPIGYIDPEGEVPPLAPIVWTYMRCVASCTARSMVHDALTGGLGDCIPETLADHTKDCALECVFPNRLLGKLNAGKSNFWPPSLTPPGGGRRAAFNEAKRRNGIPTSQSPNSVKPNVDRRGKRQPGRVYEYSVPGRKEPVIIRDDAAGHYYGAGNSQNRGPHFNDSRGNHYDY